MEKFAIFSASPMGDGLSTQNECPSPIGDALFVLIFLNTEAFGSLQIK
jgi:hypothetical protein